MASDRSLAEQKRAQQSITILVMDDDANLCHLIRLLLTQYRFTALHALSAEEALQLSARHTGRIDLLLADIAMAGTSGPQLAQEIGATQPNVRLLYVEPRDRRKFPRRPRRFFYSKALQPDRINPQDRSHTAAG